MKDRAKGASTVKDIELKDFERRMYWLVKRRRTHTLATWLFELNAWKWPKVIPNPESREATNHPRRNAAIDAILRELGWRMAKAVRDAEASK